MLRTNTLIPSTGFLFGFLASLVLPASPVLAGGNPVDELRQLLEQREEYRFKEEHLNQLDSIPTLREAWELQNGLPELTTNQTIFFREVEKRLKAGIHKVGSDPRTPAQTKIAIAEVIGTLGESLTAASQSLFQRRLEFVRSLIPTLLVFMDERQPPLVRRAGVRALGKSFARLYPLEKVIPPLLDPEAPIPEPKMEVRSVSPDRVKSAVLAMVNNPKAENRLAAVKALDELLRLYVERSNDQLLSFDEVLKTGEAVIKIISKKINDPDVRVRRINAELLRDVCISTEESSRFLKVLRNTFGNRLLYSQFRNQIIDVVRIVQEPVGSKAFLATLKDPDPAIRILGRQTLDYLANIRLELKSLPAEIPKAPPPAKVPEFDTKLLPLSFQKGKAILQADDPLAKSLVDGAMVVAKDLYDSNVKVRLAACEFLEKVGDAFPADADDQVIFIAKELSKRLEDRDVFVRWAASRALGKLGLARMAKTRNDTASLTNAQKNILAEVVLGLEKLISERDAGLRFSAANALEDLAVGSQKPESEDVRDQIKEIIQKSTDSVIRGIRNKGDAESRAALLQAFKVIGINPQNRARELSPALNALEEALKMGQEDQIRVYAAQALGSLGPIARPSVPTLEKALKDDSAKVRQAASDALLRIVLP